MAEHRMSQIVIGKSGGKNVHIDIPRLLATRLLIQADSGGGKSWLLRVIAERLFGKVQLILVDPEGEFATLREEFGFVLVGKGGETPADPRSAALVAHKLLELRASAICDIYEMKHQQRHAWVRTFLEAMIDIPKTLWGRQVVVIIDEAHMFCPEKGKGESEAYGAMVDLCTRGRKRGYCASQLQNRLIGPTFEDINRKRAAEVLGVLKSDEREFFKQIQLLDPGNFFALGRAISKDRILVRIGEVETTHPEAGSSKHAAEPPPAPTAIAKLLPKLSDLPKAAEERAKTEAELRTEIRSLKAQLRVQPVKQETKEVRIADSKVIERAVREVAGQFSAQVKQAQTAIAKQQRTLRLIAEAAAQAVNVDLPKFGPIGLPKIPAGEIQTKGTVVQRKDAVPAIRHPRPDALAENNGDLSRSQVSILKAIAEFEAIGRTQISKAWIAARAGASYTSSAFGNNLGFLRSNGYISYPVPDTASLTEKAAMRPAQSMSRRLQRRCCRAAWLC